MGDTGTFTVVNVTETTMEFNSLSPKAWLPRSANEEIFAYIFLFLTFSKLLWNALKPRGWSSDPLNMAADRAVWNTVNWDSLYGILHTTFEFSPFTLAGGQLFMPLQRDAVQTVQKRWFKQNRPGLSRLLERGIIPLRIHDGGVSTAQLHSFEVNRTFPFIHLPLYRQAKERAYFEFIVPFTENDRRTDFIDRFLGDNSHLSRVTAVSQLITLSDEAIGGPAAAVERSRNFPNRPSIVGAESIFELLLPFLADDVLDKAKHIAEEGIFERWRRDIPREIGLLYQNPVRFVRLESKSWRHHELDVHAWSVAEAVDLPVVCHGQNAKLAAAIERQAWVDAH